MIEQLRRLSGRFDQSPARDEASPQSTEVSSFSPGSSGEKRSKKKGSDDKVRRSRRKLKKRIVREFAQLDVDEKGYIVEEDVLALWKRKGVDTSTPAVRG